MTALPLLAGAALGAVAAATSAVAACDFDPIDARFAQLLQTTQLNGGAVLIGRRDGLLHERYFGNYDVTTVVPIASATKLLSAVRMVQLAERGIVDLDQPLVQTLPQFAGARASMTLRQMFSHTAGYGDDEDNPVLRTDQPSLAAAVDTIACCIPLPNTWLPGAQFAYGGISMQIGGRVAEVATAQDWQQGWRQAIGLPLGIASIDWQGLGATTNYRIAGGARSNLRDYGKVLQMLAADGVGNGRRLLGSAALQALTTDQVGTLPIAYAPPNASAPIRYALGNWIESDAAGGAAPTLSSLGAFGYFPWLDRQRGIYGVFMLRGGNGINSSARPVYLQMLQDTQQLVDSTACTPVQILDPIFADPL